jgi:hypothetical protein
MLIGFCVLKMTWGVTAELRHVSSFQRMTFLNGLRNQPFPVQPKRGQRAFHGALVNKNLPLFLCLLIRN